MKTRHRTFWLAIAICVAPLAAGCGQTAPPQFRLNVQDYLNMMSGDERTLAGFLTAQSDDDKQLIDGRKEGLQFISSALYAAFGTPDAPYLLEEIRKSPDNPGGLDLVKLELAAGPARAGNQPGARQRGLYREHCAHCHGISGDGAGPTASFLNPFPRDYRQGKFKFKSTEFGAKPTTDDLIRILKSGIPGTAMPTFGLLPEDEIEALVEYVRYLSVRGTVEAALAIAVLPDGEPLVKEPDAQKWSELVRAELVGIIKESLDLWNEAEQQVIRPPEKPQVAQADWPQWLAAGKKVFLSNDSQCVKCHGPTGLGDGASERYFDDWNDFKYKHPGEYASWQLPMQELKPRDLRMGIYRGGRRPIDIYRRIYAGIAGGPMPGAGPAPGKKEVLTPEQIWQLVDYVLSLPYEAASSQPTSQAALPRNVN